MMLGDERLFFYFNIGKRTVKCKPDGQIRTTNIKPFKSGFLVNTIKDVILHPILRIPAYTFEEDDSYVECRRCYPVRRMS